MSEAKDKKSDEIDLITVFIKIWQYRLFIIIFTGFLSLASVLYALLAKEQFQADVKLYKEEAEVKGSQLKSLASQFGFGGVEQGLTFSIEDLLKSRKLQNKIILKSWDNKKIDSIVNLINYWEIEGDTQGEKLHEARLALENLIAIEKDKETGLIIISVLMPEPQLAADIANYITELITEYVSKERKTSTQQNINYIKERLSKVEDELANAENALKEFREHNRVISTSPQLQLEFGRLQRKVTIKQEVYLTLQKELELAEIELVKEKPVINILDQAVKPEKRFKPKRTIVVIVGTFLGFFLSLLFIVFFYVRRHLLNELEKRNVSLKLFKK